MRRANVALRRRVSAARLSSRAEQRGNSTASDVDPSIAPRITDTAGDNKKSSESTPIALVDRLFPKAFENLSDSSVANLASSVSREVPRLSLEPLTSAPSRRLQQKRSKGQKGSTPIVPKTFDATELLRLPPRALTPILRLDNASKNLNISDFRRLIPQGKHLEGWNLTAGDIISVVPGRTIKTLSQQTNYLLLFSNAFSAQRYMQHAIKMHALMKHYTRSETEPSVPVPPGHIVDGMDVEATMKAFTIGSPHQRFNLFQVVAPLTDNTLHMVTHGGPEVIFKRPNRMPFELRLSLYGQQISPNIMQQVFSFSGYERGLQWSGDQNPSLNITRWEASTRDLDLWMQHKILPKPDKATNSWATGAQVYIVGFQTEAAAQSFLHYWHKRPLTSSNENLLDVVDDVPPVVELEALW